MANIETLVLPGAIDLHVHLREPSANHAETIASGTRAALLGGYVLVADMPNNPGHETWSQERLWEKSDIVNNEAYIPVGLYAGSQPSNDNIGELSKMAQDAIGLKLYGAPTTGNDRDYAANDFRPIVEEWHKVAPNKPIMLHAGKENLEDMVEMVAGEFGHSLHICHVNDPGEVEYIQVKKFEGLDLTCGVCPHHLFKTSHDVKTQGWFARMQPPLVGQIDSEKLFAQLVDGKIDVVETDHAPHSHRKKMTAEYQNIDGVHDSEHTTCFGVPGIEFALPLLMYQAKRGQISIERIVEATSEKPASILGVKRGIGTEVTWNMSEYRIENEFDSVQSGAGWTPYLGMLAVGTVDAVSISRYPLVKDGFIIEPGAITRAGRVVSQRGSIV